MYNFTIKKNDTDGDTDTDSYSFTSGDGEKKATITGRCGVSPQMGVRLRRCFSGSDQGESFPLFTPPL